MHTYATLTALRARLGLAAADTADDARLLGRLRAAAAQIDRFTGRVFVPMLSTRRFDYRRASAVSFGRATLLTLTAIINGDGLAIDTAAATLIGSPAYALELDPARAAFTYSGLRFNAIAVTGLWGYHPDYAAAWRAANDAPGGALNASAGSFAVSAVNGLDAWNLTPRFQPGQLLRIDDEFMLLTATATAPDTLTVIRGALGTTAATHSAGAPISVYTPPADLSEAALRWAAWLLKIEDAGDYADHGERAYALGASSRPSLGGAAIAPSLPPDLAALLAPFCAV
jgi:hypothetical protein